MTEWDVYDPAELDGRRRYQLLTSLVVPRPIGWLGTRSRDGCDNLAPFSYFAALSASPMLVGVSIGHRPDGPKDSLRNIRDTGGFTANIVDETHLVSMNASSIDAPPGFDEFRHAGLEKAGALRIDAPFVASAPAVLECRSEREIDLGAASNTLIIGRVLCIRLKRTLERVEGTDYVRTESLRPAGRLYGGAYLLGGEVCVLPRPTVHDKETQ